MDLSRIKKFFTKGQKNLDKPSKIISKTVKPKAVKKRRITFPILSRVSKILKSKDNYGGIYSCIGWSGGKISYLLGCSVKFPYNNEDRSHAWTQSREREGKLSQPVNLGCRRKFIQKNSLNYNSENCIDKLSVFEKFDALKIPHPRLVDPKTFEGKFLGRRNGGSRGRGITIYKSGDKIREHDFFVELLECKSEHRIHFFKGKIVCELNKKIKEDSIIHTAEQGSPLEIGPIIHPKRKEMIRYGLLGIQAMELDFGAVDIFVDINDKVYILEVNSDPGMAGLIGFLYAIHLREYFKLPSASDSDIISKMKINTKKKSIEVNLKDWLFQLNAPAEKKED